MKKQRKKGFFSEIILVLSTLVMLTPLYYMFLGAFKSRKDIIRFPLTINAEIFTLDNFSYVIKKMKYVQALGNTALITICSLLITIFFASLAGYAIARIRSRFFEGYYRLLISMMVIPFVCCMLPLVSQFVDMHLYNTRLGCILIQAGWNMPFAIFLFTGFMKDIPKELEEAAYIDGCSTFGVYLRIFLPLLAPVTATCAILCGTGAWNDYLVARCLLNENKMPTLMVGISTFFGKRVTETGYAFAGILLVSLPMFILFLFLQKYFIKGIAAGAVKG